VLTSKQRAALRAEAHHLDPIVHVGHQGATPAVHDALGEALRTKELVKVAFARALAAEPKEVANDLARVLAADVVQVIGRTATFYRENPELPRAPDAPPPWRR
jgi:RNA-binding protein